MVTMATILPVICSLLFGALDGVISTVLYTMGTPPSTFTRDVLDFNILSSVLDLWGTVLLRGALLLGASMGVSWNKEDGPQRVARVATVVLLLCMVVITYALAKLLMLIELEGPLSQRPWPLSLIAWTCASSLAVVMLWKQLGRICSSESRRAVSNSLGGGGRVSEDTEKLVEAADEEEEEAGGRKEEAGGRKEASSSRATLGRLLSYCRKDSGLLSVAVLFLLISAVCEYGSGESAPPPSPPPPTGIQEAKVQEEPL